MCYAAHGTGWIHDLNHPDLKPIKHGIALFINSEFSNSVSNLLLETTFKAVFPFCPYTETWFLFKPRVFFSYCAYFVGFVLFFDSVKSFSYFVFLADKTL